MKYITSFLLLVSILLLATCSTENNKQKNSKPTSESLQVYIKKGQSIAVSTFATLSSNLQKAMQEGGVQNAVQYCNLSASPLVDSLQKVHQATICRTSLKLEIPITNPPK